MPKASLPFSVILSPWPPDPIDILPNILADERGAGVAGRSERSGASCARVGVPPVAVMKAVLASPPTVRAIVISAAILLLWLGVNWAYHAYNKPTEVFFPLDDALDKSPSRDVEAVWVALPRAFDIGHHSLSFSPRWRRWRVRGNPVARTYWRWRLSWNPLDWYQPASSAVGMYQITDGTFREAKRYCIHDHVVVEDGPWHDLQSCWFNSLYTRVVPSHAIELTAASLDRAVANAIGTRWGGRVTLRQKQDLAALIHLCGAGAGQAHAARGFRLALHQRCGDHDVRAYLLRVNAMKGEFARLAAGDKTIRQGR